jgi:hypothetical protein
MQGIDYNVTCQTLSECLVDIRNFTVNFAGAMAINVNLKVRRSSRYAHIRHYHFLYFERHMLR